MKPDHSRLRRNRRKREMRRRYTRGTLFAVVCIAAVLLLAGMVSNLRSSQIKSFRASRIQQQMGATQDEYGQSQLATVGLD